MPNAMTFPSRPVRGLASLYHFESEAAQPTTANNGTRSFTVTAHGASIVSAKLAGRPPSRLLLATRTDLHTYHLPRPDREIGLVKQGTEPFHNPMDEAIFSPTGRFLVTQLAAKRSRQICCLYDCTNEEMLPDLLPLFAGSMRPLAISDCGEFFVGSTEREGMRLFTRPMGSWVESTALGPPARHPERCEFSRDASQLLAQFEGGLGYLFRRDGVAPRFSLQKVFRHCWDLSLLYEPSRVFARIPGPDKDFQPAFLTAPAHPETHLGPTEETPWAEQKVRALIGSEALTTCGEGVAYARVMRMEDVQQRRVVHLLKICFTSTADLPMLFDVSDPWASANEPCRIEWPSWQRPLLVFRRGSPEAKLIECFD